MNFIRTGLLALLLLSGGLAFGQITEDPEERGNRGKDPLRSQTAEGEPLPFSQRLRFGGGISNLQLGNPRALIPFIIGVSPVAAYQASERLVLGVGVNYVYYRLRGQTRTGQTVTVDQFNQYGGRGFTMFEILPSVVPNLYAHAEFEGNNIRYRVPGTTNELSRRWVTAPMLGATYSQRVGRRSGINLTALYNFNYNSDIYSQYVYGSPWVLRLSFF